MANERYLIEQISEHLYAVGQAPTPAMAATTDGMLYLVVGEESVLAVDAGSGTSYPFVRATAVRYAFDDRPIRHVLLTHEHWDHAWGLPAFRAGGAITACPAQIAAQLPGYIDPGRDLILRREGEVQVGEFLVDVVHTPGHTLTSTCYRIVVDGTLCLFTGDTIAEDGGLGYAGSPGFSREALLGSLRKLAARTPPADRYLPGHLFSPTFDHPPAEVLARGIARGEAGQWADDWSARKEHLAAALFEGFRAARDAGRAPEPLTG